MSKSKKGVRNFAPKKSVTAKQARDMSLVSVVADSTVVSVAVNSVNTHKYSHPTGHGQVAEDFFAAKNGGEVIYSEGRNFKNAADVIVNGEEFQVKCHATASSANRAIRDSEGDVRYSDDMGIVVPTEQVEFLSNRGVNAVDLGASYTDIKEMSFDVSHTLAMATTAGIADVLIANSVSNSFSQMSKSKEFHSASLRKKALMLSTNIGYKFGVGSFVSYTLTYIGNWVAAIEKIDIPGMVGDFLPFLSLGTLAIEISNIDENTSFLEKISIMIRGLIMIGGIWKGHPMFANTIANFVGAGFSYIQNKS